MIKLKQAAEDHLRDKLRAMRAEINEYLEEGK